MLPPAQALVQLRAGNERFVDERRRGVTDITRRLTIADNPQPFAIILGCADARVPPELIFDQGLGDLFVVRIAGNIASPAAVGSIELAADQFGSRLIVVLGHTKCSAVATTINALTEKGVLSDDVGFIVEGLRHAIEPLMPAAVATDETQFAHEAIRANILATVETLRYGSPVLQQLAESDGLEIVGAEYAVETGIVEFL